jgi:SAP domain-containing ribonucleoprotein
MSNYNSKKVAELKEILKERNLPLSGTKPELIARLEEHDSVSKASAGNDEQHTSNDSDVVHVDIKSVQDSISTKVDAPEPEEKADIEPSAGVSQTKNETTKDDNETEADAVIAELEKRVRRAKKFGDPNDADVLIKQINRIRTFGLTQKKESDVLSPLKSGQITKSSVSEETLKRRRERFGTA